MTTDDLTTFQMSLSWIWHGHHTYSWWNREFYSIFICSTLSLVTWLLHVFLIFELYCTSEMKELIYEMNIIRVTMDEAKEVHTCLRAAGGMFKFVKVFRLNMIHFGYPFLSQKYCRYEVGIFLANSFVCRKVWCHALVTYQLRKVLILISECWRLIRCSVSLKHKKVSITESDSKINQRT